MHEFESISRLAKYELTRYRLTGQSVFQPRGTTRHRQGILTITQQRIGWFAYGALLVALAALAFGGLHDHGVYFHDDETFRDNARLAEDPAFFLSAEREHRAGRPVASLIKWWAIAAAGNEAGPAHLVAVAGHTLASLLLAGVCLLLGLAPGVAALAGLLFLLNVAHFQAVFHIAALDFPLALMLSLLSRVLWRPGAPAGHKAWANVCLVAAMACHLSVVVLVLLRLHQSWQAGAAWRAMLRDHVLTVVMVVVVALLLLSLTPAQTTTSESLELAKSDPLGAVTGALRMLAWMAARLVTSTHWLAVDLAQRTTPELLLGVAVLAGLVWLSVRSSGPTAEWAAWSLAFVLPYASISEQLATRGREGPSHYLYLATAGVSVLLALGLLALWRRLEARRLRLGWLVTGVLVVLIGASSLSSLWRLQPLSLYNTGRYLFDRR